MSRARFLLSVFAALYVGALIGLTFVPTDPEFQRSWFFPFAAFLILGATLLLLWGPRRWWAAIGFGVLGSAWIEAAQAIWMPVGYASIDHVLWASAGVVVGVAAALVMVIASHRARSSHVPPSIVAQAGRREIP